MGTDSWNGWVGFAALVALIIGMIDFVMGLIAIIRGEYYAIHGQQLIIFDTTTWGWLTLLMGIAIVLVGLALANGSGFARWLTIVVVSVNLLGNLSLARQQRVSALVADARRAPDHRAVRADRALEQRRRSRSLIDSVGPGARPAPPVTFGPTPRHASRAWRSPLLLRSSAG